MAEKKQAEQPAEDSLADPVKVIEPPPPPEKQAVIEAVPFAVAELVSQDAARKADVREFPGVVVVNIRKVGLHEKAYDIGGGESAVKAFAKVAKAKGIDLKG